MQELTEAQRHRLIDETERALAGARRGARWNREQLAEYLEDRYRRVGVDSPQAVARLHAKTALDFAESVRGLRAHASVAALCLVVLSFLVGCGGSYTEPAPHCGPACQDQRELEDEAWIDYQEWLAEQ